MSDRYDVIYNVNESMSEFDFIRKRIMNPEIAALPKSAVTFSKGTINYGIVGCVGPRVDIIMAGKVN